MSERTFPYTESPDAFFIGLPDEDEPEQAKPLRVGAQLRREREALGLPLIAVGKVWGVTRERVRQREARIGAIPRPLLEALLPLLGQDAVGRLLAIPVPEKPKPEPMGKLVYYPAKPKIELPKRPRGRPRKHPPKDRGLTFYPATNPRAG